MRRAMLWSAVVVFGLASVSGPASAQMGTPAQPPGQAPSMGGGGMMPGMMCPMMMGGMGMMGSSADPKLTGRMLQMRGEMMKAMGDVMMKHGKMLEEGK